MATDWRLMALRDAGVAVIDCEHRTPAPVPQGYPYVTIPELRDGRIDAGPARQISAADFDEWTRRARPRQDDVVLSRRTNPGETAYVPDGLEFALGQNLVLLRADGAYVFPPYLRWLARGPDWWRQVGKFLNVGAVFDSLRVADIPNFELPIPPIVEQRAIAGTLGALDDKIGLNQRMNETLVAVARALFRSWFVDFVPVRAEIDGRDQGLSGPVAGGSPRRFQDSELGQIPEGWQAVNLGRIVSELVSGARPRGGAVEAGVPSIGAENVLGLGRYDFSKEKFVPRSFFEELKCRGAAVRPSDVLLYKDGAQIGRKTYFDRGFPHEECAINEHVFIIRTGRPDLQRYLILWLDQDWVTNEIIALNSNSAQPGINQPGVRGLPLLLPPPQVIAAFDALVRPLTDRLFANCIESQNLAALRDLLLPEFVSGKLRVREAIRHLEAAPA
jgi:type I restriction enzyme, S subunit